MRALAPAIGMIVGLAVLVIALWKSAAFRRQILRDANIAYALGFAIMGFALLGGWAGYWIHATLFNG